MNIKKIFLNVSLFRITYVILSFFEMIIFVSNIAFALKCAALLWAFFIFLYNFFKFPEILNIDYKKISIMFVLVGFINSFLNISQDFFTNLTFVAHSIVCFFFFFGAKNNTSKDLIKKEIKIILYFFSIVPSFLSILSIIILIFKPEFEILKMKTFISQDRFLGFFTNSNLTAFASVISVFSIDLLKQFIKTTKRINIINIFFTFINILIIFFSDSNASFIFIIIYLTVRIFISNILRYTSFKEIKFLKELLFLFISVTMIISVFSLTRSFSQRFMAYIINKVHIIKELEKSKVLENSLNNEEKNIKNIIKFGREIYREDHDISSGRVILFKQGIEIFKKHPIFGIGRGNLVNFSKIYLDGGLIFSDLHNSYLTILVCYGILGFLIFIIFLINILIKIFYNIFIEQYSVNSIIITKFFSIISAYMAYALFEKAILSEITFMVIYFWLILGHSWFYIDE